MNRIEHPDLGLRTAKRRMPKGTQPRSMKETKEVVQMFMVAEGKKPHENPVELAQNVVKVLKGAELGLGAIESLSAIYVIASGGATTYGLSAWTQRAMVFASGVLANWDMKPDPDNNLVSLTVQRVGLPERTLTLPLKLFAHRINAALKRHQSKGGKGTPSDPWILHPMAMLEARISTQAIRAMFPDLLHGVMCVDELDEVGDGVASEQAPQSAVSEVDDDGLPPPPPEREAVIDIEVPAAEPLPVREPEGDLPDAFAQAMRKKGNGR